MELNSQDEVRATELEALKMVRDMIGPGALSRLMRKKDDKKLDGTRPEAYLNFPHRIIEDAARQAEKVAATLRIASDLDLKRIRTPEEAKAEQRFINRINRKEVHYVRAGLVYNQEEDE